MSSPVFVERPTPEVLAPQRYPRGIAEQQDPPRELFLWGQLPPPPWVAIVGTREPSLQGGGFARTLAAELATRGVVVASGGAFGIDAAAHEGALDVGAHTVVVGPTSFDHPSPPEHSDLFARVISSGGGYLSLFGDERKATRPMFFARNRLLVACCELVVVVEAPLRSGARNAALWARRLGRPLYVVPHPPWAPKGRGCLAELKLGARVLTGVKDILQGLSEQHWPALWSESAPEGAELVRPGQHPQGTLPFHPPTLDSSDATTPQQVATSNGRRARLAVAAALERGARHPDQIQSETGLPIAEVQAILTALQLERR